MKLLSTLESFRSSVTVPKAGKARRARRARRARKARIGPVEHVRPVEPVEPVKPVEPMEPILVQSGSSPDTVFAFQVQHMFFPVCPCHSNIGKLQCLVICLGLSLPLTIRHI